MMTRLQKNRYMRRWYKKNRRTWLNYKRKYSYGANGVAHFETELAIQKGLCAVCGRKMSKPNQDHNHHNKKLRGVLCNWCNTGLAFVENKRWMKRAAKYLKVWK